MKTKLLTLAALAILSGCNKDKEKGQIITKNKVIYTIRCESCTVEMDVAAGKKIVEVKNVFSRAEVNQLKVIKIKTTGSGEITTKVIVNDVVLLDDTYPHTSVSPDRSHEIIVPD
ncbi:MAG: hypothetical protein EOO42_23205 [Flavobacteriales bacterium]|nr:MAG: hypothetical protein EOO42_23205 [Flavobacteriales bacterium]